MHDRLDPIFKSICLLKVNPKKRLPVKGQQLEQSLEYVQS